MLVKWMTWEHPELSKFAAETLITLYSHVTYLFKLQSDDMA